MNNKTNYHRGTRQSSGGAGLKFLVSSLSLAVACAAGAQSERSIGVLEEIVVTGTKRDTAVQDVPIAISTVTAEELGRSQFNDIRALGQKAPGLVLSNPSGFNAAGGGMRGTGTNIILVTQDAPVSFLIDDFSLSHVSSQFLNMFDIQQVEVYRGPQGTLFGKNATGGVISLTSKKPIMGQTSGEIDVSYGQHSSDGNGVYKSYKGAVNLPLGENIAFRLAAIYDEDDGFYEDSRSTATFPENVPLWGLFGIPEGTPVPPDVNTNVLGTGKSLGGKEVFASKAKLLWEPTQDFSAYMVYEYVRDRSDSPPGVNESMETDLLPLLGFPGLSQTDQDDPFSTLISHNDVISMDDGHQVDVNGLYLNLDWDLGHGLVKSITGYREEEQQFPSTYTGESFLTLFDSTRNTERETFQQEFRYVSQFSGPFNFSTGATFSHDEIDFFSFFSVGLTSIIPVFDADTNSFVTEDGYVSLDTRALTDWQFQGTQQERDEYGVYWDGTYDLDDKWAATLGLRYSKDTKKFVRFVDGGGPCNEFTDDRDIVTVDGECRDARSQYLSRAGLSPAQYNDKQVLPLSQFGTVVDTEESWEEMTYRTVLNYKPDVDELVYLSYATGFLSGGFSETCATVELCSYNPETNQNLELGYKADLFDNRVRLNAALYYTVYEDLQRAVVATYTAADTTMQQETVTVNTGESELLGLDLEATWVPTAHMSITAALNLMDHEYKKGILPDLRGAGQPIDLTQFDVPYSPEVKAMLSADYEIPVSFGRFILAGSMNYQDETETDVFNSENTQMDERTLVDLSITFEDPAMRWAVSAFVANATDEEYRVAALPVAGLWNFTNYGAPRSFGIKARYNFGM